MDEKKREGGERNKGDAFGGGEVSKGRFSVRFLVVQPPRALRIATDKYAEHTTSDIRLCIFCICTSSNFYEGVEFTPSLQNLSSVK